MWRKLSAFVGGFTIPDGEVKLVPIHVRVRCLERIQVRLAHPQEVFANYLGTDFDLEVLIPILDVKNAPESGELIAEVLRGQLAGDVHSFAQAVALDELFRGIR